MFKRFTERASRVIILAREAAELQQRLEVLQRLVRERQNINDTHKNILYLKKELRNIRHILYILLRNTFFKESKKSLIIYAMKSDYLSNYKDIVERYYRFFHLTEAVIIHRINTYIFTYWMHHYAL
jgi:short-subunit dehydrogenase involved in D-alanine esterification of teichoic acids